MQLNNDNARLPASGSSLRAALAASAGALIASPAAQALEQQPTWEIDSGFMYYSEKDRVSLLEGVVDARYAIDQNRSVSAHAVFDTLTGASPNGAIATDAPQTFTRPSGQDTYTTGANERPLDDTFHDTRVALNVGFSHQPFEDIQVDYGLNGSVEYDYQSFGFNTSLAWDLFQHNTTLSVGAGIAIDSIDPVGGVPVGMADIPAFPAKKATEGGSEDKLVLDMVVSWSQVLTPRSLIKTSVNIGIDDGYQTDPYKLLSVVDPATGALLADPDRRYRTEKRPDEKLRWAWHTLYQYKLGEDVLRLSYRYYGDDWGISSHTLDGFYRWQTTDKVFLEPHLRLYTQSQADFYHTSLRDGQSYTEASADTRLADMLATTVGVTVGWDLTPAQQLRLSAEWYRQETDPSAVIGVQRQQDLGDELDVYMIRIGYTVQW